MSSKEEFEMRNRGAEGHTNPAYVDVIDPDPPISHHSQPHPKDDDDKDPSFIQKIQNGLSEFYERNQVIIKFIVYAVLICLYFIYFGYAISYKFGDEASVRLFAVTIIVVVCLLINVAFTAKEGKLGNEISTAWANRSEKTKTKFKWIYYAFVIGFGLFALLYVIFDVILDSPTSAIPLAGLAGFVILFYLFSNNPAKVKWRPVILGLYIQFAFACIILRWRFGFQAFEWLGARVSEFLSYSDVGAQFIFGDDYVRHFFAFKVLPVIIFFSTAISMLYYLGVMQFLIRIFARAMAFVMGTTAAESLNAAGNIFVGMILPVIIFFSTIVSVLYYLGVMQYVILIIARAMSFALGTSPAESLNAAGNIFIGQSEAPLLIRPIIHQLTLSELHAVLTGGFATIAGSVMAAYILYGVPANHLLAASVMSAPAALAMSKLFYPEDDEKAVTDQGYNMEQSNDRNLIDAASNGACSSVKLVANVAANLIAFLSILAFVNATLAWFGARAGLLNPVLTFELICSYVFYPMAFMMGVDPPDCSAVGELIGVKTFLNEFVAYSRLSVFLTNRKYFLDNVNTVYSNFQCTNTSHIYFPVQNHTLIGGIMTVRSEVVATYALCGFANIGSMGIMLGSLGAMAPTRKGDLSRIVLRAMIAGNVACFMTACIAAILLEPSALPLDHMILNNTLCTPPLLPA